VRNCSVRAPGRAEVSVASGLEARGLHALPRQKAIDGLPVHAKDAPHANGIQPAVVNQPPDRLRMHAELVRDLTDTDEATGLWTYGRHNPSAEDSQVSSSLAWADRTKLGDPGP
jgi:hypothetical protein